MKGYGLLRQTITLHIFYRLFSTNFTWSILEYFVPFDYENKLLSGVSKNVSLIFLSVGIHDEYLERNLASNKKEDTTQLAFTCSKLMETAEQNVKSVQN